jgi:hypothetical protein
MATISFFADGFNLNGSGLGFYGDSFGQSVDVGEYQDTTFITNGAGTVQGEQVNNVKYLNEYSGAIASATAGTGLLFIPNYLATLNVRFEHGTPVKVQNVKVRVYDRVNINNAASGVTSKVAELIHPSTLQTVAGSGDTEWHSPNGSSVILDLAPSPGISGIYAGNGSNSTRADTRHDHYLAISQSPNSIGSKLSALHVSLEYL